MSGEALPTCGRQGLTALGTVDAQDQVSRYLRGGVLAERNARAALCEHSASAISVTESARGNPRPRAENYYGVIHGETQGA